MVEIRVADHEQMVMVHDHNHENNSYRFELGSHAKVTFFIVLEHGSLTADFFLTHASAHVAVYGLYVVNGQQKVELSLRQHHLAANTTSTVVVKGILLDQAHTNFNGTIVISPGAHTTKAVLFNKNLVISPGARAVSQPRLEVHADAVQCKHGSAIGALDQEHLFYAQSRGLSQESAQRLLLHAFAHEIIAHLPTLALQEHWKEKIALIPWQKE